VAEHDVPDADSVKGLAHDPEYWVKKSPAPSEPQ